MLLLRCIDLSSLYSLARLSHSTVSKIVAKFNATGSVLNLPRTGRPSLVDNEDVALDVLARIEENWYTNITNISREIDVSRTTVWRILKKHKYHAYKAQTHHNLIDGDEVARLEFCNIFIDRIANEDLFLRRVLWSDESLFTMDGVFNKQNKRLVTFICNPSFSETHEL